MTDPRAGMVKTEIAEYGTITELCLKSMALKAAITYIDAVDDTTPYSKSAQEAKEIFDQLRKELPEEYQSDCI